MYPLPCIFRSMNRPHARPTADDLEAMYARDGMTAQAIADQYGVAKISALRWLKSAGIERRASGGLARRGGAMPTRNELDRMIHVEHLSYREIAGRYGVDFTAVSYWMKKYGDIESPTVWGTRRKGEDLVLPDDAELRRRLESGQSIRSIGEEFGGGWAELTKRAHAAGMPVSCGGWKGRMLDCKDGHQSRSRYEQRVDDWLYDHGIIHECEPQYPWDRRSRADFRVGGTFIEVWGVTGSQSYEDRKARKIRECAVRGLPLIQINHWQFSKGRKWWRPLENLAA